MFDNIKDMMAKLQEAQQQAGEVKNRLNQVELKEDNGEICIRITGNREIKDIEIHENLLQDREELEDKLVLAINRAIARADETHEREMESVARGMMPGTDIFK